MGTARYTRSPSSCPLPRCQQSPVLWVFPGKHLVCRFSAGPHLTTQTSSRLQGATTGNPQPPGGCPCNTTSPCLQLPARRAAPSPSLHRFSLQQV